MAAVFLDAITERGGGAGPRGALAGADIFGLAMIWVPSAIC